MKKVVFLLITLLLITGCSVKKVKELTDAEKFAGEYNVSEDNPFVYATFDDIENVRNHTGIIFFGNPDIEGSSKTAKYLYSVAVEESIDLIYYYNPMKIKEKNPKEYKNLVKYFDMCLTNEKDLSVPLVIAIKNGKVTGYSNYFSKKKQLSEDKLTEKQRKLIKENYRKILEFKKSTNCYN